MTHNITLTYLISHELTNRLRQISSSPAVDFLGFMSRRPHGTPECHCRSICICCSKYL